jgi:protein SCO1/2
MFAVLFLKKRTRTPEREVFMTTNATKITNEGSLTVAFRQGLLVLMAFALVVLAFLIIKPVKVMPVLDDAPSYELTSAQGELLASADLAGKVALVDFIYTHCTTVCPAMTGQMLQVQEELIRRGWLGDQVELVTITFDPARDTPERLAAYSEQMGADPQHWHWLTGETLAIKQLVGGEFGVYFEQVPPDSASAEAAAASEAGETARYDFIHSTLFVLVDGEGRIRAEYQQMLDINQVMRDISLVLRESRASGITRPIWQAAHLIEAYP